MTKYVTVPVEPTAEMMQAGKPHLGDTATAVWSAMLSAAPGGEGDQLDRQAAEAFFRPGMGFDGPHKQDTLLQAAAREAGWALMSNVDAFPWERRQQVSDICHRLAVSVDAPPEPVAWRPTHRHAGRGGEYQVIGTATVQTTEGLCDYDTVTLYRDTEGLTWARHIDEFNDGRFVALPEAPLQAKEGV